MKSIRLFLLIVLVLCNHISAMAVTLKVSTDATEISRKIVKTKIEIPVKAGQVGLYYPEWAPGIHGPRNPIQNLAEISFTDSNSNQLKWERDPLNSYRFIVEVPRSIRTLSAHTTYIASQPSVNSRGVDTYGNEFVGLINWNTLLIYPEGQPIQDLKVDASLTLPDDWKWASSLDEKSSDGDTVSFQTVSFEEFVDSPLFSGKYLRSFDITPDGINQKTFIDVVSESENATNVKEELLEQLTNMVAEAKEMFGVFHFDQYHLLVALSEEIPGAGVEHLRSSHNVTGEPDLTDIAEFKKRAAYLLPHEYCHSWCGKYRRPAGMLTPSYNEPKDTRMLWVYEGLDQYLGYTLTYRAGMLSFEEGEDRLTYNITRYMSQKGRRSIPLEDTASSAYLRRGGSPQWGNMVRGQDYYVEGMYLWMEIDALLRKMSDSKLSLDDFNKKFFAKQEGNKESYGFEEEEIVSVLNDLIKYDWASLIDDHVRGLHDNLPLDFLEQLGYRITYKPEADAFTKELEKDRSILMLEHSLGMRINGSGTISNVIPGSLADEAGLYDNVQVVGVNDRKYSIQRMRDALADSTTKRSVDLLLLTGDVFESVSIPYDGGERYLRIEPNPNQHNFLKEIWSAKVNK